MTVDLICMRACNMARVHPGTTWAERCDVCHEPVGIYPSGQKCIVEHGRANVRIVCEICIEPPYDILTHAAPLPETLQECRDSKPFGGKKQ